MSTTFKRFQPYSLSVVLAIIIFSPIFYFLCCVKPGINDYQLHIAAARNIADGNISSAPPHFFFQAALLLFHYALFLPYREATFAIMIIAQSFCVAVVYHVLSRKYSENFHYLVLIFISLSIVSVHALTFLFFDDHLMLRGYFTGAIYHNPTFILIRPVALLATVGVVSFFQSRQEENKINTSLMAALIILSAIIKPNYLIVLLPALALLAALYIILKKAVRLRSIITAVLIPAVVILILQFVWTYHFKDEASPETSHVIIAPFIVFPAPLHSLIYKLLLSITFPLFLLVLYFKRVVNNKSLQLAWLMFIVSLFYSYLLAEDGPRLQHGNFVWGTHISTFLLFFFSVVFLLQLSVEKGISGLENLWKNRKITFLYLVYGLHLACGIWYFISKFYF